MALQRGDIIVSREDTFSSWLMRVVTQSAWSHASLYVDNMLIVSSVPFCGVSVTSLHDVRTWKAYRVKNITDAQRDGATMYATDRIGRPYDFLQALLLGYRLLSDTIDVNDGDPSPDRYVCSELVAEAYASQGVVFGKIVDNVLPGVLAKSPLVEEIT